MCHLSVQMHVFGVMTMYIYIFTHGRVYCSFSANEATDEAAAALARSVKLHRSLAQCHYAKNSIGAEGARLIADALYGEVEP